MRLARDRGSEGGHDAVRDAVRREWENARRKERIEQFYRDLLEKYTIIVERPKVGVKDSAP